MNDSNSIEILPISGALGAEIHGVDLTRDLSDGTIATIRAALLEHLVIFFRDQHIDPPHQLAFAKRFGEIAEYPMIKGLEDYPEIVPVIKMPDDKANFGGLWHTDTAYLDMPPMGAILAAKEVPPYGGDTLFSNMYLAYERLSEGMHRMLDDLIAINSSAKADVTKTREDMVNKADDRPPPALTARHPVVRIHPETGRKALYVNFGHTVRFQGMTEAESTPILNYLFRHQVQPEFTCCFKWRRGSIAFWDNRAVLHNPVNDYHGYKRVMHRIIIAGEKPH